jgi:hypothetical protein
MTTITIPSKIAEVLRKTAGATRLVDEEGNVLGSFSPEQPPDGLTPEQWAELKRRKNSPGPRYTTEQVLNYLASREVR